MHKHLAVLITTVLWLSVFGLGTPVRAGEDLIVDFGSGAGLGVYVYFDDTTWSRLHGLSPEIVATSDVDCDGADETIVDFGPGVGLYVFDFDQGWTRLHGLSPESLTVGDFDGGGCGDIAVDFGAGAGLGLWVYYNNSTWVRLHGLSPESMAAGDLDGSGVDELIVDFGSGAGLGLYLWVNNAEWFRLHATSPDEMVTGDPDCGGRDVLVVDFGPGGGLWAWSEAWSKLSGVSPEGMAVGDLDGTGCEDLVVDFGSGPGLGIYILYDASVWFRLHATSPDGLIAGDLNGDGSDELIVDFGAGPGLGIYVWDGAWDRLHGSSPEGMFVGDLNVDWSCRELLILGHVVAADDCFQAALGVDPNDTDALFLSAVTRIARVFAEQVDGPDPSAFTDSFKEMLDQLDASPVGRSIFSFIAEFPDPLPADSPTGGELQEFLRTVLLPELDAAIAQLQVLDQSFSLVITTDELVLAGGTGSEPNEVDYADAKFLEAGLLALKWSMLNVLLSWDLDLDVDALPGLVPVEFQADILDLNPNLFGLVPDGALLMADAKAALSDAIEAYFASSNFIRNLDDPDQTDDIITIDPLDLSEEALTRAGLGQVYCSLLGEALIGLSDTAATCTDLVDPVIDDEPIDLSAFYDTPVDLRTSLPTFQYDAACEMDWVDASSPTPTSPFPDPTFSGTLIGMTQEALIAEVKAGGVLDYEGWVTQWASPGSTDYGYASIWVDGFFPPPIEVTGVRFETGTEYQVSFVSESLPFTMCGDSGWFWIEFEFSPTMAGIYTDTLIIESDLPDLRIDVQGNTAKASRPRGLDVVPDPQQSFERDGSPGPGPRGMAPRRVNSRR